MNMDRQKLEKMIAQGYVAVVYVAYGYAGHERGEIVSRHRRYEAAARKAKGNPFWAVAYITDLL